MLKRVYQLSALALWITGLVIWISGRDRSINPGPGSREGAALGLYQPGLPDYPFFILLSLTNVWMAAALALFEFIVHYHIDWAKMNINRKMGWKDENSEFWVLLGADQLLHYLTYVLMVAGAVR